MKLKEMGEFELIERMAAVFRSGSTDGGLAVGIGDDAAVWAAPAGGFNIATTDAMVEGTHFTAETTDWYDLGWKAMASNISDIAGMGGVPRYGLTVLGAPGDLEVEDVLSLCQGAADLARRFGATVVGGDTVSAPITMISITLMGEASRGPGDDATPSLLSRYRARPGDLIAVTGSLGSSAGGLDLLLGGGIIPEELTPLVLAHRRPMPRVAEGQLLVKAGVRCGMDLSDGLAGDLLRICQCSNVSAVIEAASIPMDPLLASGFGDRALGLAVSGGEDYELLCTAPPDVMALAVRLLDEFGTRLTVVGSLVEHVEGEPLVMVRDSVGRLQPPPKSGWEHFTSSGNASRR